MKNHKTITTVLAIIPATIFAWLLDFLFLDNDKFHILKNLVKPRGLIEILVALVIAAIIGAVAWLMLVWDAGDKIPPLLMILIGLPGLFICLVEISTRIFFRTNEWMNLWYYPTPILLSAFYFGLGVVGLFTKPKTK